MRTPHRWASLALLGILLPSLAAAEAESTPDIIDFVGDPQPADGRPRPSYVRTTQIGFDSAPSAAGGAPTIFFINKAGGTYRPGSENSRTNNSSIIDQVSSIPAWNVSATGWTTVKSCLTTMFERWNVTVTDVDPGANVAHYELVIAGRPENIGMDGNVGGVSPFTFDCSVIPNSITYTFAAIYGNDYQSVCETAAQEIAHSFGLDHERLCSDPMTYMNACGDKAFQDVAANCGEYSNRACECNGNTQNSVQLLNARLGLAGGGGGGDDPIVEITAPADGATVAPGFAVNASTIGGPAVARVELYIDGAFIISDTTSPYSFTTAATLAPGSHQVEARAIASDGGSASDTVSVTISGGGGGGGGDPDAGPGGGGGDPDAGPGDPGGDPGDDDGNGGYVAAGCAAHDGMGAGLLGLGLIAFSVLWAWRRRRTRN